VEHEVLLHLKPGQPTTHGETACHPHAPRDLGQLLGEGNDRLRPGVVADQDRQNDLAGDRLPEARDPSALLGISAATLRTLQSPSALAISASSI
jgi:hypothetical protein